MEMLYEVKNRIKVGFRTIHNQRRFTCNLALRYNIFFSKIRRLLYSNPHDLTGRFSGRLM